MPPYLRPGGEPVNQRKQGFTRSQRLCRCQECVTGTSIDPVTFAIYRGRYVGASEWKEHQNLELARGSAYAHLSAIASAPPDLNFGVGESPSLSDFLSRALPSSSQPPPSPSSSPSPAPSLTLPPTSESNPKPIEQMAPDRTNSSLMITLQGIQATLGRCRVNDIIGKKPMVFCTPPTHLSVPMTTPLSSSLTLQEGVTCNNDIVAHGHWLDLALDLAQNQGLTSRDIHTRLLAKVLIGDLEREIAHMHMLLMREWEFQRNMVLKLGAGVEHVNTGPYISRPLSSMDPLTLACHLLIAVAHLLFGLSLNDCRFVLEFIQIILRLSFTQISTPFTDNIEQSIPRDIRMVLDFLALEPKTKAFVCCPQCYQIYPLDPENARVCPDRCTHQDTKTSDPCGRLLFRVPKGNRRSPQKPLRLFLYHDIREWIAQLYCLPGMEDILDRNVLDEIRPDNQGVWDIWDAPGLRDFLGPDNKPFVKGFEGEGRLVFSLNMDGFNPYMNKQAGKKVSVGGIYMVCLNLPPAIRYEIENMYLVGIIPGPQEPSLHQINHILKPLVDDLLQLWTHGFYLTSTPHHPRGRLIRGAVVPLVCDLPAARQMSGYAPHGQHNFCSLCTMDSDDIKDFNYTTWKSRSWKEHMALAEQWRDASSEEERAILFDQTGVRWSELLRLPYWDPTKFVVIDSMHAFFLRILQRHCRDIWGMNVEFDDGDGASFNYDKNLPTEEVMESARTILRTGTASQLAELTAPILWQLCREAQLRFGGYKKRLLKSLLAYRISRGWFSRDRKSLSDGDILMSSPSLIIPISISMASGNKFTATNPIGGPEQSTNTTSGKEPPIQRKRRDAPVTPEELAEGMMILNKGTKSKLARLRKAVLLVLCTRTFASGTVDFLKDKAPDLLRKLTEWRIKAGIVDASGNLTPSNTEDRGPAARRPGKATKVLGRETLAEIRADMEHLRLPSWVSPAPRHPGVSKRGKFTADQWRTFCTINLVFTLTRLWGAEPRDSRKRRMLDNFMHLVTAVKLANMRKMTESRILRYEFHMHQYLSSLLKLYPGTTITPYQHLSLHYGTLLRRFGPTHAWRCFPFERYNYMLQRIPTNMKFGELEQTLLQKFCMGQKLRSFFQEQYLPSELDPLIETFDQRFQSDVRGTLLNDSLAFNNVFHQREERQHWNKQDEIVLSSSTYDLLKSWLKDHDADVDLNTVPVRAFNRTHLFRLGERFQVEAASDTESKVYFRSSDSISAGCVQGIFSHTRKHTDGSTHTQTFFTIKPYAPLSDEHTHADHYRRFPIVAGQMFYQHFLPTTLLLSSDEVLYQFGYSEHTLDDVDFPCIHALPLDRS